MQRFHKNYLPLSRLITQIFSSLEGLPSNLDELSTINILNYPEQENAPAKIFLKIGACPSAYKKKLEEAIIKAILEELLILKFDTFLKAEFILNI